MISEEPGGAIRFTRAGMLRGVHGSNTIMLAFAPFGVVAGIAAQEHGLSLVEAALMSAFVFAGSAQLLVLSTWTEPASVIAATFAALVINLRFALMGPVLAPWLDRVHGWRLWLSLFVMVDQNWALSVTDLRAGGRDAGYLIGSGATLWVAWLLSSIAGYAVGAALKPAPGHPLFFAALATFIGMLVLLYRGRGDVLPWAVAAAITGSALAAWRDIRNGSAPV